MAKVFGNAGEVILSGLKQYISEVTSKTFPTEENWFSIPDEEYDALKEIFKENNNYLKSKQLK